VSAEPATPNAGPLLLVVEDEAQVAKFLRMSLEAHDYRVLETARGREALRMASQYVPDLVLLDLGLPDLDGLEVTRAIRTWSRMPIVIVSARGQERQKVEALDAGADDYLTKPFSLPELLARIRVALRHAAPANVSASQSTFRSGPLEVDFDARKVTCAGREVHLTPIEFKLLGVLTRNVGKVVTQKQLLQEVWGPQSTGETQYLRVYMTHLRRKLEPGSPWPRLFVTEAGVGYRLAGDD
jgi:two-component system KDP operon response regulator KdpE